MSMNDDPRQPATGQPEAERPEPDRQEAPPPVQEEPEASAAETTEYEGEEPSGEGEEGERQPSRETVERREQRRRSEERLRRQAERLQRENNELRARTTGVRIDDVDAAVARIVGPEPKETDFGNDYLAWNTAKTAWELDRRQTRRAVESQVRSQETSRQAAQREALEAHAERVEDFKAVTPDFDDVMKKASSLQIADPVYDMILESDHSAHLAYYLARNPDEVENLNTMSPVQAARRLGSIEARLSMPTPNRQTRAPARPFRPLTGGAAPEDWRQRVDGWTKQRYGDQNRK